MNANTELLNYLRITGLKMGVSLNFKRAKLEWEGIVLATEVATEQKGNMGVYSRSLASIRGLKKG